MTEPDELLDECIAILEHLGDSPFLEPSANAAWCRAVAAKLIELSEILQYD